ncbi:MAG: FAD-dependent oxidoreductase [Proteobacteria bacterium]|nr:FAD-dependent oxidoreductase [Pseudomonadota bacterium]
MTRILERHGEGVEKAAVVIDEQYVGHVGILSAGGGTLPSKSVDLLVIGAGVVGLTVARSAILRHPTLRVLVVDKEPFVGAHASGRNSGVLHSGVYYKAGTLKARFCVDGNRAWRSWCEEAGVAVRSCGKVIVAQTEADVAKLETLHSRGTSSGVRLEWLDGKQLEAIEPAARTHQRALWCSDTGAFDPEEVMLALADELAARGVEIRLDCGFERREDDAVVVGGETVKVGHVVNAAGLQADKVARLWNAGEHYRILPFRGLYLYGEPEIQFRTHIYPVPDLTMPFLGVHFTVTRGGRTKIGPTAMPALWREQYGGLSGLVPGEMLQIGADQLGMLLSDPTVRRLGMSELRKLSRSQLLADARALVNGLDARQWTSWGRPGIRAQLLDLKTRRLHMDFVVEPAERSTHVLNAISPAFTCALPFADHVVETYLPFGR